MRERESSSLSECTIFDFLSMKTHQYSFRAKVWKYKGHAGWYFVTLPKSLSVKIRKNHLGSEEGWGRLKSKARIGKTLWDTAIWYDSKHGSYLLPIKAQVRKAQVIGSTTVVQVYLMIEVDNFSLPL